MNEKIRLKNWYFIAPSVLLTIISIAYLSGGPRVPMDNDQTSSLALAEKEAERVGEESAKFDVDIPIDNLVVKFSEPIAFTIKDEFVEVGENSPNLVIATITNNGSSIFEAYSFSLGTPIIENNLDAFCEQVFPMQSDLPAQPENLDIEPGGSRTFHWVYICQANRGDPVSLNVTVTEKNLLTLASTIK